MAERRWTESVIAYVAVVVAAGVTYYVAQTAVEAKRFTLPALAYIDCVNKLSAYDWSKFPGTPPSASEVCGELSRR